MAKDSEIVCFCTGITLEEIESAAQKDELNFLYEEGMSQQCGSCREDIKIILKKLVQEDTDAYYR